MLKTISLTSIFALVAITGFNSSIAESVESDLSGKAVSELIDSSRNRTTTTTETTTTTTETTTTTTTTTTTGSSSLSFAL